MRSFFGNCKICHIYAGMNFHDYMTFIGNEEDQKISAYLKIMSLMSDLDKE